MKTLKILLIFFICFGTRIVFSQTYYPISDTNAVWDIVLYPDPENPYPPMYENHFKYRLEGDTLINSVAYQKLIRTTINTKCSSDTYTELDGFLRNDVESHKVYYRDISQADESLLYDFNLQIGDTLKGSVFYNLDAFTVSAIDSILINANYHKRYSINLREFFMDEYLIEGIGTTVGLLERVSEFWPFYKLRCYSENGQLGYLSPWATECQLESDTCYVGIEEKTDEPKVLIFPNPARDYVVFEQQGAQAWQPKQTTIQILTVFGQVIETLEISGDKTVWLTEGVEPGIYFYTMKVDGFTKTGKIVISK